MMRFRFFLLLSLTLAFCVYARAEEDCFDQPTNLKIDRCLAAKLVKAEQRLTAATAALSKQLDKGELALFKTEQTAWAKYRDLHCRVAGAMFSGGRMEPLTQGACRVRMTTQRIEDLKDIDVSERAEPK